MSDPEATRALENSTRAIAQAQLASQHVETLRSQLSGMHITIGELRAEVSRLHAVADSLRQRIAGHEALPTMKAEIEHTATVAKLREAERAR